MCKNMKSMNTMLPIYIRGYFARLHPSFIIIIIIISNSNNSSTSSSSSSHSNIVDVIVMLCNNKTAEVTKCGSLPNKGCVCVCSSAGSC